MSEIGKELQQVARLLIFMDIEDMESHLKKTKSQLSRAENIGHIIDPTAYRDALQSGELENAKLQQALAEHLLEARKIIEQLHPSVKLQLMSDAFIVHSDSE